MATQLLVRRSGIFIDFGMVDGSPMTREFLDYMLPQLSYNYVRHLRGHEQLLPDGGKRHVEITQRRLYDFTPDGRVQTGFGFTPRVVQACNHFGYALQYVDISQVSDKRHPERYVARWDLLEQRCGLDSWRPRQFECMQTIANTPGGIISAVPAFGKGELIARMGLLYPRAKIAVVTKRCDVARTLERRLYRYLPEIGFIGDNSNRSGRITIFVAKSMHKAHADFDFLLADEIHELAADSFAEIMVRAFCGSRMFGFSATWDGRADGASPRLEYLFGPEIFKIDWPEAEALGLVVPIEVRWVPMWMDHDPCAPFSQDTAKERHGIWTNRVRNARIAETLRTHGDDEQCLVLVRSIEHAVHLKQHLPEYELCYDDMDTDDRLTYIHHGLLPEDYVPMDGARRDSLRNAFEDGAVKKVIATDVWSTGVSFDRLAVLFRADARNSEILDDQAPGRVARIHAESGKEVGLVYDCWDAWNKSYLRRSEDRYRRYGKKQWRQQRPQMIGELA